MDGIEVSALRVDHLPAAHRGLRVAVVTETYPPEVNGVAMTIASIVQGLQSRNHDIQLVRPRQAGETGDGLPSLLGLPKQVLTRGFPIPRYPDLRMGAPSKRVLVKLWSLHRPDVVHIATEGPLGWSALQAARHLQLPLCSDFRTNFHSYSKHYGIGWLQRPIMAYLRKFHNLTRLTMVPTVALKSELEAQGFRGLRVVARGVDLARFDPAHRSEALRAGWGADASTPVVLYVGRLAAEKNLGLLLDAFEAMRAVQPALRLVLVGDGPLREELQQRCPEAIFAGRRQGHDLAVHYASADCFMFPSQTETFGNVVIEAMASGLPVLAFAHAAAGEVLADGLSGRTVALNDAAGFVRAGVELIEAGPEARAAMGRVARQVALDMGWPRIVDQFEGVLREVERSHPQLLPAALPLSATQQ